MLPKNLDLQIKVLWKLSYVHNEGKRLCKLFSFHECCGTRKMCSNTYSQGVSCSDFALNK